MKQYVRHITLCLTTMAFLGLQSARAEKNVNALYALPMHVQTVVDESGCDNSPGPQITIGGEIELGAIDARLIFSNNRKGTHTASIESVMDVALLLDGSKIVIPKQPVLGGVGGNPHLYLQFTDCEQNALSEEFYLGRCVQGVKAEADLLNEAMALATIKSGDCSNRRGPTITMDGTIVLSGLNANLILRNNVKGTHTAEEAVVVSLILEGTTITLPKQPVQGGAGGNPLISIQFLGAEEGADAVLLGRCNQL